MEISIRKWKIEDAEQLKNAINNEKNIFENTDIIRIFAEPFAYNIASCKVLEKAGFELEGILRSNAIKNEKILDMKMYSIIK